MYYFIVNENARTGKGAEIWKEVRKYLDETGLKYEARVTEYVAHAVALAEEICCKAEDEEINLIVIGGDGTINEVINGITDFEKVRFGIIVSGSGNDFGRGLGIKGTPLEQMKALLDSEEVKPMDLGKVSWNGCTKPRLFGISSGVGLDALVTKKALTSKLKTFLNKIHLGKLTYIIITIQTLFTMDTFDASVGFDGGKLRDYSKMIFSAGMNFFAEGGGVPMAPSAKADDGYLSFCMAYGIPKWKTFFMLPFLALGKHDRFKEVKLTDCKYGEFHLSKPMVLHADGEYCGNVTEVRFECLPEKLRLMK